VSPLSPLHYISLGAGVQSSALLVMSDRGDHGITRADVAIFADTQDEPAWVYEQLGRLRSQVSIPIEVVTAGKLSEAGPTFLRIPAFTEGGGMIRRQCTSEFKIRPLQRAARRLGATRKNPATAMIGISTDEAHRMKPSLVKYIVNTYPLVDARLSRLDCVRYLEELDLPVPKKSACVFCPYHSDAQWKDLKQNYPAEWERAVAYDKHIRNSTKAGERRPAFIHRSCRPLDEVDLNENQRELFGNECEGMCGV
jgi:hypothetical protein